MPEQLVDAVVVSYNSSDTLRPCVLSLSAIAGVAVTVVDNASPDDSLETIADLPVMTVESGRNGGFSFGCNLGAAHGSASYVLLVNPDARIEAEALRALVAHLDAHEGTALASPRILDEHGTLQRTMRRFPRLRSTWAQALFLHRIAPYAAWSDEVVWDRAAYDRPACPQWVSGACMLIRRRAWEAVGGLDERFFLYCEDIDICHRLWSAGWTVDYVPAATVTHQGGASAPRPTTWPIYARSRLAYARKHYRPAAVMVERAGVAVGEVTHALAAVGRPEKARGHVAALHAILSPSHGA